MHPGELDPPRIFAESRFDSPLRGLLRLALDDDGFETGDLPTELGALDVAEGEVVPSVRSSRSDFREPTSDVLEVQLGDVFPAQVLRDVRSRRRFGVPAVGEELGSFFSGLLSGVGVSIFARAFLRFSRL